MEHVVFFPAHDGTPAFRRVAGLEDAVRLVEHLRNVEGINEVSCHALTEVPLAFRAYYRVEVPGVESAPEQPVAEAAPAEDLVPTPVLVEDAPQVEAVGEVVEVPAPEAAHDTDPEPAMAGGASSNGRANDGAKSLGFFA